MSIPRIKIQYLNGQLGTVGESADGLLALVCGGTAVSSTFTLETPYGLKCLADLDALGVTSANNPRLYKHVSDFYSEAEDGTKLVIYGVAKTLKMAKMCAKESGVCRDLILKENGALRGIIVARDPEGETPVVTEGLDSDVYDAMAAAQALAEWATTERYAPLFFLLEGRGYTATSSQKDLSGETCNRVAILVGDTSADTGGAAVGLMAGRIASVSVQRNIGRVQDGKLAATTMYIGSGKVDESDSIISTLYDKRYITPRKYIGRSGYFFADDNMCCLSTDDYAQLSSRRVIDKAYRIAYDTLLDMMLDELEVNEDGTLQTAVVKAWQQAVVNAIGKNMTAGGELSSSGENDNGCRCFIDETQNVVSTSKIVLSLKVRPHGYARYVDVNLGFLVTTNN